ncbi:diacylglycerol/lipid kinase family protein [Flavimarina sp. Hel_I_48]|uniref:diacylglycerol/lipid kinase family protein n=1 Tax=Flavimarina sp. Hel_I_48 TaxID=1392488 RepID=UPI0004DF0E1A|nr:YegS/Rv2252/BmrU family lipid kinase [Flavimarina sp. Hel_I_48]
MATTNKILLIVNPISGDRDKDKMIEEIREHVQQRDMQLVVHKTDGNNDAEKITQSIKETNPARLLVAGGDGTVKMVAELLEDQQLPLGIIPAGSANGLATNLGIQGDMEKLVEIALDDHFIIMDILLLNDTVSLHIADLGLNAALIKNYEDSRIRGKLGYMLSAIPTLSKTEYPFTFEIEANGQKTTEEGILLAIANANSFGTGANINPTGKVNDGQFEVLVFKKLDFIEIAKTLYGEVEMDPEFVSMVRTKEATITSAKEIAFQIDGEYMGESNHVKVKLSDKKLKVAVPRS